MGSERDAHRERARQQLRPHRLWRRRGRDLLRLRRPDLRGRLGEAERPDAREPASEPQLDGGREPVGRRDLWLRAEPHLVAPVGQQLAGHLHQRHAEQPAERDARRAVRRRARRERGRRAGDPDLLGHGSVDGSGPAELQPDAELHPPGHHRARRGVRPEDPHPAVGPPLHVPGHARREEHRVPAVAEVHRRLPVLLRLRQPARHELPHRLPVGGRPGLLGTSCPPRWRPARATPAPA